METHYRRHASGRRKIVTLLLALAFVAMVTSTSSRQELPAAGSLTSYPVGGGAGSSTPEGESVAGQDAAASPTSTRRRKKPPKRVELSENIFAEDLTVASKLETTYYVTDAKQMTDFFWFRGGGSHGSGGGIRVNIGLQTINVIPVYDDVVHQGDNEFIIGNPSFAEESQRFQKIVEQHCRTPLPDHYSLAMEVSKDRMTKASLDLCSESSNREGKCPDGVERNEWFLHRTINEPCAHRESYPEPLVPAMNSIVCTDSSSLLRLFNATPSSAPAEIPIAFQSRGCKTAEHRCQRCLERSHCQRFNNDVLERRCCEIDCYAGSDCKQSYSTECRRAPVECAMGDTYRYTLQPIFLDLDRESRCHLHHRKPSVLFQLWFYVTIPGFDFETPKVNKTVPYPSEPSPFPQRFQFQFLSVDVDSGLILQDDIILVAREDSGNVSYLAFDSGPATGSPARSTSDQRAISDNIRVLLTRFSRPFAYSTSSWAAGNSCSKDLSKFVPFDGQREEPFEEVLVAKRKIGTAFEYLLKSPTKPPSLKFLIPGNTSLIRWWFHDRQVSLVVDSSLSVRLDRSLSNDVIQINISGRLTACPGYLSVIITDKTSSIDDQLFHYDLLVSCPYPDFNASFFFPTPTGGEGPRTFEIQLDDTRQLHRFRLTSDDGPRSPSSCTSGTVRNTQVLQNAVEDRVGHSLYGIPVEVAFIATVCSLIAYVVASLTRRSLQGCSKPVQSVTESPVAGRGNSTSDPSRGTAVALGKCGHCASFSSGWRAKRLLLIIYVLLRLIYNILFAFSVFYVLVTVCLERHLKKLERSLQLNVTFTEVLHPQHLTLEAAAERSGTARGCCEPFSTVSVFLEPQSSSSSELPPTSPNTWNRGLVNYGDRLRRYLVEYRGNFERRLNRAMRDFSRLLRGSLRSEWLLFPQSLFNGSLGVPESTTGSGVAAATTTTWEMDFALFLGIAEVEGVQEWTREMWKRYDGFVASHFLESFLLNLSLARSCDLDPRPQSFFPDHSTPGEHSEESLQLSDSTRYFAPSSQQPLQTGYANGSVPLHGSRFPGSAPLGVVTGAEQRFRVAEDIVFGELGWSLLMTLLITLDLLMFFYRLFRVYLVVTSFRATQKPTKPSSEGDNSYPSDDSPPPSEPSGTPGTIPDRLPDPVKPYHVESPIDDDKSPYYAAFQSQFPSKINFPEYESGGGSKDTLPKGLLRILWDAILDRAVVPELAIAGFITTLLLAGMELVADSSVRLRFETSAWVRVVGGLADGYTESDTDTERTDLERSITSEMMYLDAMIAHLCAESLRFAANLSVYGLPSLCIVKSDGNASTAQSVWPGNRSSTMACLTAPLVIPVPDHSQVQDALTRDVERFFDAVLAFFYLTLLLITVLTVLRSFCSLLEQLLHAVGSKPQPSVVCDATESPSDVPVVTGWSPSARRALSVVDLKLCRSQNWYRSQNCCPSSGWCQGSQTRCQWCQESQSRCQEAQTRCQELQTRCQSQIQSQNRCQESQTRCQWCQQSQTSCQESQNPCQSQSWCQESQNRCQESQTQCHAQTHSQTVSHDFPNGFGCPFPLQTIRHSQTLARPRPPRASDDTLRRASSTGSLSLQQRPGTCRNHGNASTPRDVTCQSSGDVQKVEHHRHTTSIQRAFQRDLRRTDKRTERRTEGRETDQGVDQKQRGVRFLTVSISETIV